MFSLQKSAKDDIGADVPDLEGKADIEKYMLESGIKCTSVHYPFYMENMLAGPFKPSEQHDGSYSIGEFYCSFLLFKIYEVLSYLIGISYFCFLIQYYLP